MYRSAEIRWYFAGGISEEVRSWFEDEGLGTDEPERVDEYLAIPDCETVGVKVRDGRLEIKAMTVRPEPVNLPNGVNGWRDAWVKWSSAAAGMKSVRQLIDNAEDRWIFVRKGRHLRKFSLESSPPAEVDAATRNLRKGCQIELTSIRALAARQDGRAITSRDWERTAPWWSLSFEAFGDPSELFDHLDCAATHFFRDRPPIRLTAESSFSYPAWLARAV